MATLAKWLIADYHKMIAAGILGDRPIQLIGLKLDWLALVNWLTQL